MRCGFFLIVSLLFYGCFGSKAPQGQTNMPRKATYFNNNGLSLISATSKDSVAADNGKTISEYFFKINIVTKEVATFDSVWIGQKALKVFISKESSGEMKIALGSAITLRASDVNSSQTSVSPVPYQGKALIRYLLSGTPYYLVAQEINPIVISKK